MGPELISAVGQGFWKLAWLPNQETGLRSTRILVGGGDDEGDVCVPAWGRFSGNQLGILAQHTLFSP